ncbi:IS3 family transposase [Bacillus sp. S14(2024)]|uniref:IS3 family transposase n=1 Tax=Bacillus sp. S14(2024) TaxID=3162884 RepID=UPI003D1E2209
MFTIVIKYEYIRKQMTYRSFKELKQAVDEYIHYYNHERIKPKLNGCSPVEYRLMKAI